MARKESGQPVAPRLPPELPTEPALRLRADDHITGLSVEGDFSGQSLAGLFVEDSRLLRASFVATDLHSLQLVDVVVDGCDLSGAVLEEASFTRVAFTGCRMSGALLSHAEMRDVTFREVRLDDVNFRMMKGERVHFDDVTLRQSDFYAAQVSQARFFDCDLTGCDVSQAAFPSARFHGSQVAGLKGAEYLRDIVIESAQVLPLAERILSGLGIRVEDDRDAADPESSA